MTTITIGLQSWTIRTDLRIEGSEPSITFEGSIEGRDRFRVRGAELVGLHGHLLPRLEPYDPQSAVNHLLDQGPNTFLHVEPGQQRALGVASLEEDILDIALYPHEGVFNEIWERSRHGAPLPSVLQIRISDRTWDQQLDWAKAVGGQLPIVSATFTVVTPIEALRNTSSES